MAQGQDQEGPSVAAHGASFEAVPPERPDSGVRVTPVSEGPSAAVVRRTIPMGPESVAAPPEVDPASDLDTLDAPAAPPAPSLSEAELQRWQARLDAYRREADSLGEVADAAVLHLEMGRVLEERLERTEEAAEAYQAAFNLAPRSPAVLAAARRFFAAREAWSMVSGLIGYQVDATADERLQAGLLIEQGNLHESRLGEPEEALKSYLAALERWPDSTIALAALDRLDQSEGWPERRLDRYVRALEIAPDRPQAYDLHLEASELAAELGRSEAAIDHLLAATRLRPEDRRARDRLAYRAREAKASERWLEALANGGEDAETFRVLGRVSERLGRSEQAQSAIAEAITRAPNDPRALRDARHLLGREEPETLRRLAEATNQPSAWVALAAALEDAGDTEAALEAGAIALRADPELSSARQLVGRQLASLERYDALDQLYLDEIAAESDAHERMVRWFKLSELRELKRDDLEGAASAAREALAIDRGYQPARERLERLLLRLDRVGDLLDLYEEEVGLTEDPQLQAFLLSRIGSLAEDRLGDLPRAKAAMVRLLELSPQSLGALRALARIAEKEGDFESWVRALEREAEATDDQAAVLALMHRRAWVLADRMSEADAARSVLEQVLTLNPSHLPSLRALGRLHAEAGRWDALVAMHRRELEVSDAPRRKLELWLRIGELADRRSEDAEAAVEAYEQVLALEPGHPAALDALDALYARLGRHEPRVEIRRRALDGLEPSEARSAALLELGEILELDLDRPDEAVPIYAEAVEAGRSEAEPRLLTALAAAGDGAGLANALESAALRTEDPEVRATRLAAAARGARTALDDAERARALLEAAEAIAPHVPAVVEERRRVAIESGETAEVARLETRHPAESDPLTEAARWMDLGLASEGPEALGALERALQLAPGHPVVHRALERLHTEAERWDRLAEVLLLEASGEGVDPEHGALLRVRAAELYAERLGAPDRAEACYEAALEQSPRCLPALRGLRELAGEGPRALELLRLEGEGASDPETAAELLVESGRLLDQRGDEEGAVRCFTQVLDRDPSHLAAFNALEAILLRRDDMDGLATLLAQRAEAPVEPAERARMLVGVGRIEAERRRDSDKAESAFRKALDADPESPAALARLWPLLVERSAWDDALDVLQRLVAVAPEPATARDAYRAMGMLYEEQRKDLVRAVQAYQAAVRADPSELESLHRLAGVYKGARDWASAANVMMRLAEVEPEASGRTRAMLSLAEIFLEGKGDETQAALAFRKAIEIDPRCTPAYEQLRTLYRAHGQWAELVEVLKAQVSALPPAARATATGLHVEVASVLERQIGDDTGALAALRFAAEGTPDAPEVLEPLARLYAKREDTYPEAVQAHRRLLARDPFRFESYHELFRLFERLGQHDRAFVVAEILVYLQAQSPEEFIFFRENKGLVGQVADRALTEEEHGRWVVHPDEAGPLREAFELMAPEIGRAFEAKAPQARSQRLNARTGGALRTLIDELAPLLGVTALDAWLGDPESLSVSLEPDKPPAMVVGGRFARRLPPNDQRFRLGRALEMAKGAHFLFDVASDREIEALLWAAVQSSSVDVKPPVDPAAMDVGTRRLKTLSSRSRRAVEDRVPQMLERTIAVGRHRHAALFTANRAGLLASNDIEAAMRDIARRNDVQTGFSDASGAVQTLGRIAEVRDLLAYAVSEAYLQARTRLGFSITA